MLTMKDDGDMNTHHYAFSTIQLIYYTVTHSTIKFLFFSITFKKTNQREY